MIEHDPSVCKWDLCRNDEVTGEVPVVDTAKDIKFKLAYQALLESDGRCMVEYCMLPECRGYRVPDGD